MVDLLHQGRHAGSGVPINIKNKEVERLAAEIAELTGQTKTETIRVALEEQRRRLSHRIVRKSRKNDLFAFLEEEIWSSVPAWLLGRPLKKGEREKILGYGSRGI